MPIGDSQKTAVIVSVTSDIGLALARHWMAREWKLYGTYRRRRPEVDELSRGGAILVESDLRNLASVEAGCAALRTQCQAWDVLVVAAGTMEPIGRFADLSFDEWSESLAVNLVNPLRTIHGLLKSRRLGSPSLPTVLLFAGGGTNSAPSDYSAYTVSKVALIKMVELMSVEVQDATFAIIGPGWVRTKIHEETVRAGTRAGSNYDNARQRLQRTEGWTSVERVIASIDWLLTAPREAVSGRNFSVVHDPWGDERLLTQLKSDEDMYKLRRFGNAWRP